MRLWSLHPSYLDRSGLLAAWREGLLAQRVLEGKTRGYRNHPQLERFKAAVSPQALIGRFLFELAEEAGRRGYRFDRDKIGGLELWAGETVAVAEGQVEYELALLEAKLSLRDPEWLAGLMRRRAGEAEIAMNPVFHRVEGGVAGWERVKALTQGGAGSERRKSRHTKPTENTKGGS